MKKMNLILAFSGILALLIAAAAWAQPAQPPPPAQPTLPGTGPGAAAPKPRMGMQYDPKSLETVTGEVTQVQARGRRGKSLNLLVKTDKETLLVLIGPAFFLEEQKMALAAGDKVEVKGTRIKHPNQAMLIAGELKKGSQVVKLRDDQGKPLWAPQGPQPPQGPQKKTPANN
jgi:hypothetical protein